jgi:putative transposase
LRKYLTTKENQALAHHNTVFSQLLKLISRHEFESLAKEHHSGQGLRQMSRWGQFVALGLAQLSGRQSLRDIVVNLSAQASKLYHLGCRTIARTSLARVNEKQPYTLYEALFGKLYARAQGLAPRHRFRFKNKLYSLDTSLIDLSLSIFPWADFNRKKAALKLHVGLDHAGYLPAFAAITESKVSDIAVARTLALPAGSIVVKDKGYTDYAWYKRLTEKGIFFVTRQRRNADYVVVERRAVNKEKGLTCDQTIRLQGELPLEINVPALRRIGYRDPETGKHYVFLTNIFHLAAKTVADIYKERWQIELFFKWIKHNLKIKTFLGTSKNALLTQIYVALCMYLLLAYLKFLSRISLSLQQILRLLQLNLFERRDLVALLKAKPPDPDHDRRRQLCLV